ncbi:MAG: M23 family metallopeptidase [Eubacteriales bacterium]|nr:M23 family metallopeptidase [Eubacteriales bacterium]
MSKLKKSNLNNIKAKFDEKVGTHVSSLENVNASMNEASNNHERSFRKNFHLDWAVGIASAALIACIIVPNATKTETTKDLADKQSAAATETEVSTNEEIIADNDDTTEIVASEATTTEEDTASDVATTEAVADDPTDINGEITEDDVANYDDIRDSQENGVDGTINDWPSGYAYPTNDGLITQIKIIDSDIKFCFAAPKGTPIYAAGEGKVIQVGSSDVEGNYVQIELSDSTAILYCHCDTICVGKGDAVTKETQIGTIGATGRVTGPAVSVYISK